MRALRHWFVARAALALPLALGMGSAGCFSVDEPPCSFQCGPGGLCPDDYACQADNYCHKAGTFGTCVFGDAGGKAPDLTPAPDLEMPDLEPEDLLPAIDAADLAPADLQASDDAFNRDLAPRD